VDDTPLGERARRLPRWLVPTVLRQWGEGYQARGPMALHLRRPLTALAELRRHWQNGIEATISVSGPFNDWPRLPFQLRAAAVRSAQFLAEGARLRAQHLQAE